MSLYCLFCFCQERKKQIPPAFCFAGPIIRLRLLSFLRIRLSLLTPKCRRPPHLHKQHLQSKCLSFPFCRDKKRCLLTASLFPDYKLVVIPVQAGRNQTFARICRISLLSTCHSTVSMQRETGSHMPLFHSSIISFSGNMAIIAFTASPTNAQLQNSGTSLTMPMSIPSPVTTSSCESIHFSVPST